MSASRQSVPRMTWFATAGVLLALMLLCISFPVTVASFNRANVIPYSCLNHVISELGFPFASPLNWVFDATVALVGLLVLPALHAVQQRLNMRGSHAAAVAGYISFLALSAMGIFGLKQDVLGTPYIFTRFFLIHITLAGIFFLGWFTTVTLFTISCFRRLKQPMARPMAIVGLLCTLLFVAALILPVFSHPMEDALKKDLANPAFHARLEVPQSTPLLSPWLDAHRPRVWLQALMEWCVTGSALSWLVSAIVFLRRDRRVHHP